MVPMATRCQGTVERVLDQEFGNLCSLALPLAGCVMVRVSLNIFIPKFLHLQLKRLNQEVIKVFHCSDTVRVFVCVRGRAEEDVLHMKNIIMIWMLTSGLAANSFLS